METPANTRNSRRRALQNVNNPASGSSFSSFQLESSPWSDNRDNNPPATPWNPPSDNPETPLQPLAFGSIPAAGIRPAHTVPPETPLRTRQPAQTDEEKFQEILALMSKKKFTPNKFIYMFFRLEKDETEADPMNTKLPTQDSDTRYTRTPRHRAMLAATINGQTKDFRIATILNALWKTSLEIDIRDEDPTAPEPRGEALYNSKDPLHSIQHARVAIATWATRLVASLVEKEGAVMTDRRTGLHLRAQVKEGGKGSRLEELVTWDQVSNFSFSKLENIAQTHAPVMSSLVRLYIGDKVSPENRVVVTRRYRPKELVATTVMMTLTFSRSQLANYFQLCKGVWMFATLASKTMFRVESRMGLTVAADTVRRALTAMSQQKRTNFSEMLKSDPTKHFWVVSDNVQAYAKKREPRYGNPSQLLTGMAATAVEMSDVDPKAFDLKTLLDRQANKERATLTVDMIIEDIDWTHLENVAAFQFLQTLIHFAPALARYRGELKQFSVTRLQKLARPEEFRSKVHPLATNDADEMKVQDLQAAVKDFARQLGIVDEETLRNQCWPFSGDGKTFDVLLRLRKLLSADADAFESFQWMTPMLEIWHTKWTDLSRVVRGHYGENADDPASLAHLAKIGACPKPSNLKKVDFYDGQHMVNLVLDASILNCWEQQFNTTDLVKYFEDLDKTNAMPTFDNLVTHAEKLSKRHATTKAFTQAGTVRGEGEVPAGREWVPPPKTPSPPGTDISMGSNGESTSEESSSSESQTPGLTYDDLFPEPHPFSVPEPSTMKPDTTLANSTLFMRDAIWWREVCLAVAEGDTGRVLEMLKVWIFTFAGGGNPLYSTFLLEVYCNFKWEFSAEMKHALMFYWLVNLSGIPGFYIELDLLQEHFNFWLEEIVQHKGKEFSDDFYRNVVAMNIHHFLRLKDEMEQAVLLKARSKRHSEPHLNNELNALLKDMRHEEINKYREGRTYGYAATNDFGAGLDILAGGKLDSFVARTTVYCDRLRAHGYGTTPLSNDNTTRRPVLREDIPEENEWDPAINEPESESDLQSPRARMVSVDGALYLHTNCELPSSNKRLHY
ncbi:hypothetical protein DFP72DRAFT_824802 [Ephemerocybe angulata]|uniref:DUF6589 domain-containing protein n=1 Tax=Ephemerocybe angulata TaxID=980116 RepID=A0A8H6LYD0_9AGAR|nr:hypothetical protein DFP72DRAFT_824802 [Tulosesus angulatus]